MDSNFWRVPGLQLECLRVAASRHSFPRHYHDTYVIEVVETGRNQFWCQNRVYTANAKDIIVIHPGEMHTGYPVGPQTLSYRSVYPGENMMKDLAQRTPGRGVIPQFPSPVIQDPVFGSTFLKAHSDLELRPHDSIAFSSMTLLLADLIARHATPNASSIDPKRRLIPKIRMLPALDFVAENFHENVSLEQLSSLCGWSEFHFVREFKKVTGSAPYEYVLAKRIEESKKLLSRGLSIAEAAARTGFCDQSHFNRHFKRILGITPGLYKSQL